MLLLELPLQFFHLYHLQKHLSYLHMQNFQVLFLILFLHLQIYTILAFHFLLWRYPAFHFVHLQHMHTLFYCCMKQFLQLHHLRLLLQALMYFLFLMLIVHLQQNFEDFVLHLNFLHIVV